MEAPVREIKISRRSWLLAGLTVPLFSLRAAESLEIQYDGDNLHVSAPRLHFVIGKPLERLKDGALTVFSGIPFNASNPWTYVEAKRLIRLAMEELRGRRTGVVGKFGQRRLIEQRIINPPAVFWKIECSSVVAIKITGLELVADVLKKSLVGLPA